MQLSFRPTAIKTALLAIAAPMLMAGANAATITKFYEAFARLDADTMAQCYAPDVTFDDEVFSLAR